MRKAKHIVRYTKNELEAKRKQGESRSDWKRVSSTTEKELEKAIASDPDWKDIPRDWFKKGKMIYPSGAKRHISFRIDPDILAWFKNQGKGYQTKMNAVLRDFVRTRLPLS
jgi:uncharacterized protein (DUF4415 family)